MSGSVNSVVLVGRLTRDPELQKTATGITTLWFTVACDRPKKKDEDGQTDFISCRAWRQQAEFLSQYGSEGFPGIYPGEHSDRLLSGQRRPDGIHHHGSGGSHPAAGEQELRTAAERLSEQRNKLHQRRHQQRPRGRFQHRTRRRDHKRGPAILKEVTYASGRKRICKRLPVHGRLGMVHGCKHRAPVGIHPVARQL